MNNIGSPEEEKRGQIQGDYTVSMITNVIMLVLVAVLCWRVNEQAAALRERDAVISVLSQEIVEMLEVEAAAAQVIDSCTTDLIARINKTKAELATESH